MKSLNYTLQIKFTVLSQTKTIFFLTSTLGVKLISILASNIKKIHSEPVLSKNKKYTDKTVAKRRDPPPEPNDAPM